MNKQINQRIALYRKLANLTQTEVAEKMGIKYNTYSRMERNGSVSAERLLVLADILGVTPEMLLYGPPAGGQLNFAPTETVKSKLSQSHTFAENGFYNPAPFIPTHKEESIIKILRNLPKPYYDEVIDFIDLKYKQAKSEYKESKSK